MNLRIISGTDRPNSNALLVSRYLKKLYRQEGIEPHIIDLQDFPLEKAAGGKYGVSIPELDDFVSDAAQADGLVIVCPEYNGGYPGILKLFIDYMPFPGALEKRFCRGSNRSFWGDADCRTITTGDGISKRSHFSRAGFYSQGESEF